MPWQKMQPRVENAAGGWKMQPEGSTRFFSCHPELFVTENDHRHSIYPPKSQHRDRTHARTDTQRQTHQAQDTADTQTADTHTHLRIITNLNLGQDTTREPDPKHLKQKHNLYLYQPNLNLGQ
jgi:hypothetical protein